MRKGHNDVRRPIAVAAGVLLAIGLWVSAISPAVAARLPAFSFPFASQPLTRYDGGTAKQVGTYNFPVSESMAGVYMTLEPGALRELHWHAFAAEWAYVIEGRTRITLTSPEGEVQIADVDAGGLWYFPKGWGHSIEGLGPGDAKFLLVFNDGSFKEGSTFSITGWVSHTPLQWVSQNLGITPKQVKQLPDKQVYITRKPPRPGPLAETFSRDHSFPRMTESHVFDLDQQPRQSPEDGSWLKIASSKEFPASFNMTGAIVHLEPGALRTMHWHPNASEWQYVLNGSYDLSVFASEGKSSVSSLKQGDVGYVPRGYGHALKNTSSGPTDVLVVFDSGTYQAINLNDWLAANPESVVANNFEIPLSLAEQLPKRNADFAPN
ncbi:MAG: cupin domain-containing protein [Synechococcus sp.]